MNKFLRLFLSCLPFLAVLFTNPSLAYQQVEFFLFGVFIAFLAFAPFVVAFKLFAKKLGKDAVPKKTWEKRSSVLFILVFLIAAVSILTAVQEARIRLPAILFYLLMAMFCLKGLELRLKVANYCKSGLVFSFLFNVAAVYYSHMLLLPNLNFILVGMIAVSFSCSLLFTDLAGLVVKFYPDNKLVDTSECPGYLPLVRAFLCSGFIAPAIIGLLIVFNILPFVYNACFLSLLFWLPLTHYLQPSFLCVALPERLELKALTVSIVFFLMLGAGTWYVLLHNSGVINVAEM